MKGAGGRLIGVDIAKIAAMFLVVVIHASGLIRLPAGAGIGGEAAQTLFFALSYPCIDIFALASGYVGVTSEFRLSRVARLWARVVFTGLAVLGTLALFANVEVSGRDVEMACLPLSTNAYWYITGYVMLCFAMPFLNAGVRAMDAVALRGILCPLLAVMCGMSFFYSPRVLGVDKGYSFEWLLALYLVGAYMRVHDGWRRIPVRILAWAVVALLVLSTCLSLAVAHLFRAGLVGNHVRKLLFYGYTSPFTLVTALGIFCLCLKISSAPKWAERAIVVVMPGLLGVYLIHVQPVFMREVFYRHCHGLVVCKTWHWMAWVLWTSAVTFAACVVLDLCRHGLFSWLNGVSDRMRNSLRDGGR